MRFFKRNRVDRWLDRHRWTHALVAIVSTLIGLFFFTVTSLVFFNFIVTSLFYSYDYKIGFILGVCFLYSLSILAIINGIYAVNLYEKAPFNLEKDKLNI